MKLLLKCITSNEFTEGYDYAVVDLDTDLANLILQRFDLFWQTCSPTPDDGGNARENLYEMRFHDLSARYLNDDRSDEDDHDGYFPSSRTRTAGEDFDDLVSGMIEKEFAQLQDGFDIPLHWIARSEGDYMVIRNQGVKEPRFEVCWVCRPKHTSDHVETADLDMETLKLAARGCHLPNSAATANAIVEAQSLRPTEEETWLTKTTKGTPFEIPSAAKLRPLAEL